MSIKKAKRKEEVVKVKKMLTRVVQLKDQIAKLRDQMRDEVHDIEAILETLESAESEFDEGIRSLNRGLDEASQYL